MCAVVPSQPCLPVQAGAHDLAMEDAGIHEFNLVE